MKKTHYILIFVGIAVIALIIVTVWLVNKFKFQQAEPPEDLLDDPKNITDDQKAYITDLATRLKANFDLGFFNRTPETYKELLKLSDTIFVSVYNEFGIYEKKTLKQWFDYVDTPLSFLDIRNTIVDRFAELENKGVVFEDSGKVIFNL